MDLWTMKREINEAKEQLRNADKLVKELAPILEGRLIHVSGVTLARLKKELRDFNAHTFQWKDKK